ncbi:MAG TPA: hypothetical protein PK347_08870 [Burkholderiaceae bacterium]|nr:hypothetical protein [Burkholderiaceae bacterium]
MTTHSPLFELLNAKLQDIETALLQHQPQALSAACQALVTALGDLKQAPPSSTQRPRLSEQDVLELDRRFKHLRQALLQQSGANDRALAALLPSESLGGYGSKSAFGGVRRSGNLKSSYEV